jgi:peptide/nickel transport system substrate-binding protein
MTVLSLGLLLLALLLPAPDAVAQETPRMGGVLKVATIGEPPTLDVPMSTATLTYEIMWHANETLFTYDSNWNPIPLLADTHTVTDGGRRHTITLRRGVKFHNGKEMTAADVVPSLKRWGQVASLGKALWANVESLETKDPYTVVLSLKQPSASLLFGLAEPQGAIYPKEVIEAAGDGPLKEYIGTGPYRFVEHRPDRHIKLVRFKDYSARSEPASGFGGKRVAYFDEILFVPVPDTAVRLAGVETGEYHHAMFVKQDSYERIKSLPQLDPRIVKPRG